MLPLHMPPLPVVGGPPLGQLFGPGPPPLEATQVPNEQPMPMPQTVVQLPQCWLSVWRSTQAPEQIVEPCKQVDEQWPAEQAWPPVHMTPQPPQLLGSATTGMQWPLQNA
jgi:hypothetical protein